MNILENIVSSFIEPNIFDEPRRSGLYIRIIHTSLQATTRNWDVKYSILCSKVITSYCTKDATVSNVQ